MAAHHGNQAAARARWLAELGAALREAERLTSALARWRGGSADAVVLRIRILAARTEVEMLQRGRLGVTGSAEIEPLWTPGGQSGPRPDRTPRGKSPSPPYSTR